MSHRSTFLLSGAFGLLSLSVYACASARVDSFVTPTVDAGPDPGFVTDDGSAKACVGLECKVVDCGGGTQTKMSGKVYAPTPSQFGKPDPLYNAIVYVPNADLEPFPEGVSCDKCGTITSGAPIVTALSGSDGTFTLENVPAGDDIPIVIQVGRWRRLVTIPHVEACKDNALTAEQTRLPRNKTEGDIPQMAIVTSPYDPTECILRKIGIDVEEFTVPSESGRVHIYQGEGATLEGASPPQADALWQNVNNLKRYDIVAFPCQTSAEVKPTGAGLENVATYTAEGGRVFITDLSSDIIESAPQGWSDTASFGGFFQNPAMIDTTFPKGVAFAEWLHAIGATPQKGQLDLEQVASGILSIKPPSQRWIYGVQDNITETYSFNTPVGSNEADQCGRVVYSGFHIASTAGVSFPSECTNTPLTAQEKTLEFMLFDLAACIQKDDVAPTPPPVK